MWRFLEPTWRMIRPAASPAFGPSQLAKRYCVGTGLEIGGSAFNPFELQTRNVDYTDDMNTPYKLCEIEQIGHAARVDIVASGDKIPVPDSSEDFIVSSHVLEHFPDPIGALLEWDRIVRPGGIIFMIVPHKERTFDSVRPRTPLLHLIRDYEEGATASVPEGEHEHVWITEDIVETVLWMRDNTGVRWRLLEASDVDDKTGDGFTIVIRKVAERVRSTV